MEKIKARRVDGVNGCIEFDRGLWLSYVPTKTYQKEERN